MIIISMKTITYYKDSKASKNRKKTEKLEAKIKVKNLGITNIIIGSISAVVFLFIVICNALHFAIQDTNHTNPVLGLLVIGTMACITIISIVSLFHAIFTTIKTKIKPSIYLLLAAIGAILSLLPYTLLLFK